MIPWPACLEGLEPALAAKAQALYDLLRSYGSVMVAFSGGVDSALVCAVGHAALGDRMIAVTVHSPVETPGDSEAAVSVAQEVGFTHRIVEFDDCASEQFVTNPPDRCYFCKRARLAELRRMAQESGIAVLAEGSNADDAHDYRPGARAVAELAVRSPLAEVSLGKAEIRTLLKAMDLSVWERPSAPCLATRFPYGARITPEGLAQVAKGEAFLRSKGFRPVRVRHFGDTARIEVAPEAIVALATQREAVLPYFKELGFVYIVIDLAGYRSGSMNEVLK